MIKSIPGVAMQSERRIIVYQKTTKTMNFTKEEISEVF